VELVGINLSGIVTFNNLKSDDVKLSLANSFIDRIGVKESRNLTVYISANTQVSGKYKITLYANVLSPKFSDWGEFFIELKKANETEAEYLLAFTQKMIFDNPKCIELTELLNEAEKAYRDGEISKSIAKSREAVQACKVAIEKGTSLYGRDDARTTIIYAAIATAAILFIWAIIYIYKRIKFNKARREGYV
jgi:hypothetical protein